MVSDTQVLEELRSLGTEQNRKVYKRHGVGENAFGVSYASLKQLARKIKVNHDLALTLWKTGNHDARILATMIADPQKADDALLESWVLDLDNYVVADALSTYAGRTALAREKMEQWTQSADEWVATVGWNLLGLLALNDKTLGDDHFSPYLETIASSIHTRPNRVRHSMNNALIAIGLRSPELQEKALATAQKIGKVAVDHGDTSCKTPDAAEYIHRAAQRRK